MAMKGHPGASLSDTTGCLQLRKGGSLAPLIRSGCCHPRAGHTKMTLNKSSTLYYLRTEKERNSL